MRKFYSIIALLFIVNLSVSQVCSPDPQYTSQGIYPDTLPVSWVDSAYSTVVTVVVPQDTVILFGGVPTNVTVNFVQIDSVLGLPAGYSYQCEPSNCSFPGGTSGCILISGPAPTPADTGTYPLLIFTNTEGTATIFGVPVTQNQLDTVDTYFIDIQQVSCDVAVVASVTNESSLGASDGFATASVSNGQGNISYMWSTGSTVATVTGLTSGVYTVTVTDSFLPNCTATTSVTVSAGVVCNLSVTGTSTDASASGASDGTASVNVSGGQSTLSYLWSNGGTTQNITGLAAGTYTVTVSDAILAGCSASVSVTVGEATSINEVITDVSLSVYPNPNNGRFVVKSSANGRFNIVVKNIVGQQVYNQSTINKTTELNLSEMESGIYFVSVVNSAGLEKTVKVILR